MTHLSPHFKWSLFTISLCCAGLLARAEVATTEEINRQFIAHYDRIQGLDQTLVGASIQPLIRRLQSDDRATARRAVRKLLWLGPDYALRQELARLANHDAGPPPYVTELLTLFRSARDADESAAIAFLQAADRDNQLDIIRLGLWHPHHRVRQLACGLIQRQGGIIHFPLLLKHFSWNCTYSMGGSERFLLQKAYSRHLLAALEAMTGLSLAGDEMYISDMISYPVVNGILGRCLDWYERHKSTIQAQFDAWWHAHDHVEAAASGDQPAAIGTNETGANGRSRHGGRAGQARVNHPRQMPR